MPTTTLTPAAPATSEAKLFFPLGDYSGDVLAANQAALDMANAFSNPWRHRSAGTPLIFVRFDATRQGYELVPNRDFHPNQAWIDITA